LLIKLSILLKYKLTITVAGKPLKIISLLITTLILSLITSLACAASDGVFKTIVEAQQYCPPINGLTFTVNNPKIPYSLGSITGVNRVTFASLPHKKAIYPKNINSSGLILDAQFRSTDGIYGYITNNVITCLYYYTGFTGGRTYLVMRG
jgi:hypothetical protein